MGEVLRGASGPSVGRLSRAGFFVWGREEQGGDLGSHVNGVKDGVGSKTEESGLGFEEVEAVCAGSLGPSPASGENSEIAFHFYSDSNLHIRLSTHQIALHCRQPKPSFLSFHATFCQGGGLARANPTAAAGVGAPAEIWKVCKTLKSIH